MYAVKTELDFAWLEYRMRRAIRLEQPITVTYSEERKDPDNPKRRLKGEFEVVWRTFEPLEIKESSEGNLYVVSLDRQSQNWRSWRLDRILLYSPHRGIRTVPEPVKETHGTQGPLRKETRRG